MNPRARPERGVVLKYALEPTRDPQRVGEGMSLRPLSVGWQGDDLVLWAEAQQPQTVGRARSTGALVAVVMTAQNAPSRVEAFIGTAHNGPGGMVAHVYSIFE